MVPIFFSKSELNCSTIVLVYPSKTWVVFDFLPSKTSWIFAGFFGRDCVKIESRYGLPSSLFANRSPRFISCSIFKIEDIFKGGSPGTVAPAQKRVSPIVFVEHADVCIGHIQSGGEGKDKELKRGGTYERDPALIVP